MPVWFNYLPVFFEKRVAFGNFGLIFVKNKPEIVDMEHNNSGNMPDCGNIGHTGSGNEHIFGTNRHTFGVKGHNEGYDKHLRQKMQQKSVTGRRPIGTSQIG
jgi:hypothetical protein